jgi:hypothetical protein
LFAIWLWLSQTAFQRLPVSFNGAALCHRFGFLIFTTYTEFLSVNQPLMKAARSKFASHQSHLYFALFNQPIPTNVPLAFGLDLEVCRISFWWKRKLAIDVLRSDTATLSLLFIIAGDDCSTWWNPSLQR